MEWSTAQWNQADFQRLAQPSLSGYMISSSPRTLHQFLSGIVVLSISLDTFYSNKNYATRKI